MPKITRQGQAKQSELSSTLQKSETKAQRTFAKAACRLDIRGRSTMDKTELVAAIEQQNRRETRKR